MGVQAAALPGAALMARPLSRLILAQAAATAVVGVVLHWAQVVQEAGALNMNIAGTLTLDGGIYTHGSPGEDQQRDGGGGSGGSIQIEADTLIGNGDCVPTAAAGATPAAVAAAGASPWM